LEYFHAAFTMQHLLPMLLIFGASFIQSITGFGLIIVAAPFLLMFYDAKFTILLVQCVAFCSNIVQTPLLYKDANAKMVGFLALGTCLGLPAGIWVYHSFSNASLKLIVSAVILAFLLVTHFFHPRIQECRRNSMVTGALAGIMSTTTGMGGPPLVIYFAYTAFTPRMLRATCVAYFFFGNITTLGAFILSSVSLAPAIQEASYLLPGLALGLICGHVAFKHVSAAVFRRIVFGMLYIACIYTIYSVI
jgi:uncharacterized protein